MPKPDLSQVSSAALGEAFIEWCNAMQLENPYYGLAVGVTSEQAREKIEASRSRLDAIIDTRETIVDFMAEWRAANPSSPRPSTDVG